MNTPVTFLVASLLYGGALISMQMAVESAAASGEPAVEQTGPPESVTPQTPGTGGQEEGSEEEDQGFVPSEKVPADSAISFPVNI